MNSGVVYESVASQDVFEWTAICCQKRYKSFSDLEHWIIIKQPSIQMV